MPFPAETSRLLLRYFSEDDLEPFLAYRNDPQVFRYQGWKVPFERAEALAFIEEMHAAVPGKDGRWFQTALEQKTSHLLIGDVGFCPISGSHGQAYLGFTLARLYWNQGYALEATTAVLNYLFGELKLHRVIADCDTENTGSFRLLERLGFRREAHHCESYWLGDRWGDEYVYALLDREWASGKGSAKRT